MALALAQAGADGLVLFNRFYQPDLDREALEVVPHLVLSDSHELRLPLRWVAILSYRIPVDFAITSGVAQMRGSMSQRPVAEPAAFERANYMKVLDAYRPRATSPEV